ncbi:hypothetical protein TWF730_008065 [Orbilia blumenaviensis]|uniref:F-box domain-containing protein n=1 Tax=Orbilia blumenaviensis TaxID=1796055 RepID=A0AAV9VCJ8_9PEZI
MAKLEDLPVEIHIQILSYLTWQSKYRCSLASTSFQNVLLAHGRDIRLADCRYQETGPTYLDPDPDNRRSPPRPGFHILFQENLMSYLEIGSDKKVTSIVFGPWIKNILNPIRIISPSLHYPILAPLGQSFLLNDPVFERTQDLTGTGAEDPRRITIKTTTGEIHRRHILRRKRLLFSQDHRLDTITVQEFLELIAKVLQENESSGRAPYGRRARVRMSKTGQYHMTVYAELFEIQEPKPKTFGGKLRRLLNLGPRSHFVDP